MKLRIYFRLGFTLVLLALVLWGLYAVGLIGNQSPAGISTTAVIRELRELDRLETASFTIEKIIDAGTAGNGIKEMLFGDRILLVAHGEVVAGFDLSELKDKDIKIEGKMITLALPPPAIYFSRLDNEATRVYDRKLGLLATGDKNLESEARLTAEKSIISAACKGGILNEASQNGRNQLSALLGSLGFTTISVNIPDGSCS